MKLRDLAESVNSDKASEIGQVQKREKEMGERKGSRQEQAAVQTLG